ncbi:Crp/Fnr family transcriptional regulator [Hymenobacter sp. RP-2-7]|uniref:Crp/Fnr family transcriptional regulator n=1 Tax=Hymenobacter polaris TaxID=2682546 RepID=A0A7Y0FN16_9BACT|nr:Crp/Fnr family transcriptional regulator [Hymenobacter polaris]NML65999.1 Crp/Fnr family transcriptional regulator [Hymenobacter polaris]
MKLPTSPLQLVSHYFQRGYFPLNAQEAEALAAYCTRRQIKRRQLLLQTGEICRHVYFVVAGCLRLYAVDTGGKAHNLQFAVENEWLSDLASFYAEQPSGVFIEALESTSVLQISHDDLLDLFVRFHKFDRNFRILIERQYLQLQDRLLQSISTPAEARYRAFLAQYPHWAARLPNTQIAAYLGITPEFLSKIRRDQASAHRRQP